MAINPILELQDAMSAASGRLGALEEGHKQMLKIQAEVLKETTELRGIFAIIETHLVRLFEEQEEAKAWRQEVEQRLETLEKRQPPAA